MATPAQHLRNQATLAAATSSKRPTKKRWIVGFIVTLFVVFNTSILFSMQQANSAAVNLKRMMPNSSINASVVKSVAQEMQRQFMVGEWRFTGVELDGAMLQVYLQTPTNLQLDEEYHHKYIRQSVCPRSNHQLWQQLQPDQVTINLYSSIRNNATATVCG